MDFNIIRFLKENTFFDKKKTDSDIIKFLKENSNDYFGEGVIMYYFYFKGYTISFVYDQDQKKCIAEQIEINKSIKSSYKELNEIIIYQDFLKKYELNIESIYEEDEDIVVFLKNGVNVYFVKYEKYQYLQKITSTDAPSRKLIINTMNKIF